MTSLANAQWRIKPDTYVDQAPYDGHLYQIHVWDESGNVIANAESDDLEQCKRTAAAIAAVPGLYAAGESVLDELEQLGFDTGDGGPWSDLRVALEKARGD